SHMGRPTKVEGNPEHPASLGATDAAAQASVLTLYDPDRSQTLTYLGDIRPWSGFLTVLRSALGAQRARRGAGLRILTETVTSPTLASQLGALLRELPEARWHQWEPVGRDPARAGAWLAFGDYVDTRYRLAEADVILALDADFLGCGPAHLRYVRDFAARRARARARDQPGARQRGEDGRPHRAGRGAAGGSARVAARARAGHGRRQGRAAPRPGRQPGLHRAGRRALRGRARPRAAQRAPRPLPRRDRRALPLARPRGASARGVERRARLRRDGD